MSPNLLIYISLGTAVLSLILAIYAAVAASKVRNWRKFFGSKSDSPDNLEDIIEQIVDKIKQLDTQGINTSITLGNVARQLNTATQHVGIVRYNGNGDDGGNLSFSAALLDAHQSGILLTSLHGRQQNRIYAKVVVKGASESTLSEEEKEALVQALTNKHN
jgi:hypothetical protein